MTTNLRSRVRAGDRDAFGELFDDYADRVYQHLCRLLGNWSAAEDATSLTFLEAWRTRERLQPSDGSPLPWLLGIATNVARNSVRSRRRRAAAMSRLPEADREPDFAEDLAGRLDDAERLRAVRTALHALRRQEREVVALCVYAGLDYADAAEALGVPIGTVRSRLSRAKARLRAAVSPAPDEHRPVALAPRREP
ncbi:RNA polymerase sigma factor [Cryptosporangium minutisporangium]|uniref:Sigma-70 family RNA polymerase sigma factor n=1 Tax=Cryptosporangium minutisporangium TaxID=113569 RepID=A0ABP6SY51_9ACTN